MTMAWRTLGHRYLPVLAIRDFRLLLADRLLAPAAFAFSIVGASFAVLNATGSAADLSQVLAAQIAPSVVFTLIGGVIADRIPPQRVIIAGNVMIAAGETTFGILVLSHHAHLWQMIVLETVTGTGMALFYPASQALVPRLVPAELLQQASAVSRMAMNAAQTGGAAAAGIFVAVAGPGWALAACGAGMLGTVPLLLCIRAGGHEPHPQPGVLRELREGWCEFRSRTWLWAITAQFGVILMAWYGAFAVLGPVVAKEHLGGPVAWGAITAAESVGLICGGVASLRFKPRRPMLFVVIIGAAIAISPLSLAMLWPLPVICLAAFGLGITLEMMMIQWTVTLTLNIPAAKLARVFAYDAVGSVMAMPAGALAAGPIAAAIGVSGAQYIAAAAIATASALALIPRSVRVTRAAYLPGADDGTAAPATPATAIQPGAARQPGLAAQGTRP
jgi:hypothetical protein